MQILAPLHRYLLAAVVVLAAWATISPASAHAARLANPDCEANPYACYLLDRGYVPSSGGGSYQTRCIGSTVWIHETRRASRCTAYQRMSERSDKDHSEVVSYTRIGTYEEWGSFERFVPASGWAVDRLSGDSARRRGPGG